VNRPKWVAVVTGVIALAVSIGYLLLVLLLDSRGEFKPAPVEPFATTTQSSSAVFLPAQQLVRVQDSEFTG
jgi:hypothetical protein